MSAIRVMGTGSWGTTFAKVLADAGSPVVMWGRRAEVCQEITTAHTNSGYLGDVVLPASISATTDAGAALADAEYVVLAVPAQTLRQNLIDWRDALPAGAVLISLMKGVEHGTLQRMSEVIADVTGAGPERIAVVSGPNLAKEIAQHQPTATVVGCADEPTAERIARLVAAPYMRPYTNTDVVGVELGGALKNVTALAVGIAEGMGLGDNTKATIITRGLAETTRLALALGAQQQTLAGLAGIGDLVATCASPLSRNRTFGAALGRGLSMQEAVAVTRYTAEGVKSARPVLELSRRVGVEMPIAESLVALIGGRIGLRELQDGLFYRPLKAEHD